MKHSTKYQTILTEIISIFFIILFAYAAINKMLEFEKFRLELAKSPILTTFSTFTAFFIPIIEIVIALSLIFRRFQHQALYASFSLMVVFSTYILIILKFSPYIPCSCGGVLEDMTWEQHLTFNFWFVLLGVIAILCYPAKIKRTYLQ